MADTQQINVPLVIQAAGVIVGAILTAFVGLLWSNWNDVRGDIKEIRAATAQFGTTSALVNMQLDQLKERIKALEEKR